MKKHERLEHFLNELTPSLQATLSGWPAPYAGYFLCFNRGDFYEAHDVLEHLWLRTQGAEADFYRSLIQIAGAYVHLRKHYLRPWHYKDGRRLGPASRLLRRAACGLASYPTSYMGLDLPPVLRLCQDTACLIETSGFTRNPWRPENSPQLWPAPRTTT